MKMNRKSVRLTDREVNYIERYRGANFNESFCNMVYDMCEKHEELVNQWNRTQAEVDARRAELRRITEQVSAARNVHTKLTPLLDAIVVLLSKE